MSCEPNKKPLKDIYKQSFFGKRHKMLWRAPIVCEAISNAIDFRSVIDVGCAIGDLVQGFKDRGKISFGIEGSPEARPHLVCDPGAVYTCDLREPLNNTPGIHHTVFTRSVQNTPLFGLATCLEVAEHIEPEYAHQLVTTLTTLSDRVLVSTAPPGQGGHHHVNCQPVEYWDVLFSAHNFKRRDAVAEQIKRAWAPWRKKPGIKAYDQNLHYYEATNDQNPEEKTSDRRGDDGNASPRDIKNDPDFLF